MEVPISTRIYLRKCPYDRRIKLRGVYFDLYAKSITPNNLKIFHQENVES